MTSTQALLDTARHWTPLIQDLAHRIQATASEVMSAALTDGQLERVSRTVSMGAGDATFGLDEATEATVSQWLKETAAREPVSLLTEDAGWRHQGPDGQGGCVDLEGFGHGGPRIAVDPVDGTRNLMLDLRAAWAVVGLAGPGQTQARQTETLLGCLAELPDSRGGVWRRVTAERGAGARLAHVHRESGELLSEQALVADEDDRPDHGYLPFFAFHPDVRVEVARLAQSFFERIERAEGAQLEHCYDDQYICNAGQLVLTALGTYRMVVESRHLIATLRGRPTQTTKPYDIAGAVLCAQEAGAVVTDLDGAALDFPWDTETPVAFVAFANPATRDRLLPHLRAAIDEYRPLTGE